MQSATQNPHSGVLARLLPASPPSSAGSDKEAHPWLVRATTPPGHSPISGVSACIPPNGIGCLTWRPSSASPGPDSAASRP